MPVCRNIVVVGDASYPIIFSAEFIVAYVTPFL